MQGPLARGRLQSGARERKNKYLTCMLNNKVHYLSTKLINVIIMFTIPLKVIMVKLCYIGEMF